MDQVIKHAYAMGEDARALRDAGEISAALAAERCAWVHLVADAAETRDWIETHLAYLPEPVRAALIETATRPRSAVFGAGVLTILRGVNLNEDADPHDMISVRVWADPSRVVTLSRRPLRTIDEIAEAFRAGRAPGRAGAFLAFLVKRLEDRIEPVVIEMDERCDLVEEALLAETEPGIMDEIADIRSAAVALRRFLAPQREAVARLISTAPEGLLDEHDRLELAEAEDALRRDTEIVEAMRERLIVLRDEITRRSDAELNRNLYVLSVISAIFLPLGFLTGLMGINLAGMPGANWPPAFWTFTGGLAVLTALVLAALWRLRFVRRRRR